MSIRIKYNSFYTLAYNSADSWNPPTRVSDWLIFCCGNLMLYQKRNENDKNTNFVMKNKTKQNKKKCQKGT